MTRLEHLILDELFYESVRANLGLEKLRAFSRDLSDSVDRALRAVAHTHVEREALAAEYLRRASDRLGNGKASDELDYIDLALAPAGLEHPWRTR